MAVENDAVAALLSLLSKRDRGWCISSPVRAFDIASVAHGANRRRRSFSSMQHFRVTHRARAIGCPATNSRLSREADRFQKRLPNFPSNCPDASD